MLRPVSARSKVLPCPGFSSLGAAPFAFKGAVFFLPRSGSALSAGLGLCCHSEPAVAADFLDRRAKNPSSLVPNASSTEHAQIGIRSRIQ